MTDLADDPTLQAPRLIATDDERYNATLVRREDQHESLAYFWVKFDGAPTPFEPGQYMTIGVFVDGKIVQRPYSVASSPREAVASGYELYLRRVGGGTFTPTLWDLPVGHRLRMIGPKGKFLLEPDDDRTHLFVSTGTGLAPFISMIRETLAQGRPRRTVVLHGASYVDELGYRDELEGLQASGAYPVTYVPTISRASDPRNAGWTGRFGRVEHVVSSVCRDLDLDPDQTVVYICGNPEMIVNTETVLMDLEFPEFHVKKELYWPKGKPPASEAG